MALHLKYRHLRARGFGVRNIIHQIICKFFICIKDMFKRMPLWVFVCTCTPECICLFVFMDVRIRACISLIIYLEKYETVTVNFVRSHRLEVMMWFPFNLNFFRLVSVEEENKNKTNIYRVKCSISE